MKRRQESKWGHFPVLFGVALGVVFMAELLVYSWCRVQYVQTGYEVSAAREERDRLTAVSRAMKIEEARLRSPERIRAIAESRGLTMPESKQMVVMP